MKRDTVFYTADRGEWRAWLLQNYKTAKDVWFVFPTKASGERALSYNDAVEEALCFGWIDSTAGRLDATHGLRRFTKRREGSSYSRPNIERLLFLDGAGLLLPSVREEVAPLLAAPFVFPADIMAEIKKDAETWENFSRFSPSYQRIRIAYIDASRSRPEEYAKRLASFLKKTKENKRIVGFGGIEKYY